MAVAATQKDPNVDHLKLLMIFYYVMSAIAVFSGFIPLIYVGLGVMILNDPSALNPPGGAGGNQPPPPEFLGWLFIAMGASMTVLSWFFGSMLFLSARSIASRRRYLLVLIVAGFACLNMPLGTALGIFTFIVLLRPQVKEMFQ